MVILHVVFLLLAFTTSLSNQAPRNNNGVPSTATIEFDTTLNGREEIAKFNRFMDTLFQMMNAAIEAKAFDPLDLMLLPNTEMMFKMQPRLQTKKAPVGDVSFFTNNPSMSMSHFRFQIKAWLHGMATLKRTDDVSVEYLPNAIYNKTIECP